MKKGTSSQAKRDGRWIDALAVVHLALAVTVAVMVVQTYRIMANPETAVGVVETKELTRGNSENPDLFYLRYSFQAASGGTYRGTANVTQKIYDRASVGDPVTVQYAADDPGNSRVISETGNPRDFEFGLFGLAGLGVFVYLGPRRWLALRRGEPDPALT